MAEGQRLARARWCAILLLFLEWDGSRPVSGIGYLPRVGPPTLRITVRPLLPKPFAAVVVPPLITPPPADSKAETMAKIPPATNSVANESTTETSSSGPLASLLPTSVKPNEARSDSASSAATVGAANDLLVVTPQMLIEYFRVPPGATNGPGVGVYLPVGFTPPLAPSASSQAIYRSP